MSNTSTYNKEEQLKRWGGVLPPRVAPAVWRAVDHTTYNHVYNSLRAEYPDRDVQMEPIYDAKGELQWTIIFWTTEKWAETAENSALEGNSTKTDNVSFCAAKHKVRRKGAAGSPCGSRADTMVSSIPWGPPEKRDTVFEPAPPDPLHEVVAEASRDLLVGFDTEYIGVAFPDRDSIDISQVRTVLCASVAFRGFDGLCYHGFALPANAHPTFASLMSWCVGAAGAPAKECGDDSKHLWCEYSVSAVAHANIVDLTAFREGHYMARSCTPLSSSSVFGECTLVERDKYRCVVDKIHLTIRDTKRLGPGGSLAVLGETCGLPKLETMSEEDYRHMDRVMKTRPIEFVDYAVRDAEVVVSYLETAFKSTNFRPLATTPAYAGSILRQHLQRRGWLVTGRRVHGMNSWVGTEHMPDVSVYDQATQTWHTPANWSFSSPTAANIQTAAAAAYHGGCNMAMRMGWITSATSDIDLVSAYPLCCGAILDPDMSPETLQSHVRVIQSRIVLRGLRDLREQLGLDPETCWYMPGVIIGRFTFPKGCRFPNIIESIGETPVMCRRTGFVAVTMPDFVYALWAGATVEISSGYIPPLMSDVEDAESPETYVSVFAEAQKAVIDARRYAQKTYGKKSTQQTTYKLICNSMYGKTAQSVDDKNARNLSTLDMDIQGPSQSTNPLMAASGTAACRTLLLGAMEGLERDGIACYSITTDGFICDATVCAQDIETYVPAYMIPRLKAVRAFYTDNTETHLFEEKHRMPAFLNTTTRCNIAHVEGGVNARGGLRLPAGSSDERDTIIETILDTQTNGDGRYHYDDIEWVELSRMFTDKSDHYMYGVKRSVNLMFDMKRRPLGSTVTHSHIPDEVHIDDSLRDVVCYDTRPYEDLDEAREMRRAQTRIVQVLSLEDDERPVFHATKRVYGKTDTVRYAVTAHRAGLALIPALDQLKGKKRLEFINGFLGEEDRVFTATDWKNCGRSTRQSSLPPVSMWRDMVHLMGGKIPGTEN